MAEIDPTAENQISETVKRLVKLRGTVAKYYLDTPWCLNNSGILSQLYCAAVERGYIPYLVDEVTVVTLAEIAAVAQNSPCYLETGGGLITSLDNILIFMVTIRKEKPDWSAVVAVIKTMEQHIEEKLKAHAVVNYEPINGLASVALNPVEIDIDAVLNMVKTPLVFWQGCVLMHREYKPDWFDWRKETK